MKNRILAFSLLLGMAFVNLPPIVFAAGSDVVINEVNWAGSSASSSAEWIELYNATAQTIDLSGWKIFDDGAVAVDLNGKQIAPHGYFLIEDSEAAVPSVSADLVAGLSLANSGDKLELKNASGVTVDVVNGTGGAWYAGSVSGYLSMEKIDALAGDLASNFASSVGTPRAINSVSVIPQNSPIVQIVNDSLFVSKGDVVTYQIEAKNLEEVFAYGIDVTYDPAILKYVSSEAGGFLSENGAVESTFQHSLVNGVGGALSVAEARLEGLNSISGNGELFSVQFEVIGDVGAKSAVTIAGSSFVSAIDGDLAVNFVGTNVEVGDSNVAAVTGLKVSEGAQRYQLKLTWNTISAEKYLIMRKNAHEEFVQIGETTGLDFVDEDAVVGGGNLIPSHVYEYSVTAVKAANSSQPALAEGLDSRGMVGDNNRSDQVDGRDLQNLAMHFGEIDSDANFDALADTTYDARIDGSDLIDIGLNFAKTY